MAGKSPHLASLSYLYVAHQTRSRLKLEGGSLHHLDRLLDIGKGGESKQLDASMKFDSVYYYYYYYYCLPPTETNDT